MNRATGFQARITMVSSAVVWLTAAACGPKGPPKQAQLPDPVEPTSEVAPAAAAGIAPASDSVAEAPAPSGKPVVGKGGEAPVVSGLAPFAEGLKWGVGHAELIKAYTQTGGVLWKDFDERLGKARVGPEQAALEAEREQAKGAFGRTFIEFKDTPTGYDATGIRGEYTYKNKEALMWVERKGKKRYFFFIGDRLWKMYDEVPLAAGGPYGASFADAVAKLNTQLNAKGRTLTADAAAGVMWPTVDWKDGSSRLRAVDRSRDKLVAIVIEDLSTLDRLAALRSIKAVDPEELDPSIRAVTSGANRTDPNAPAATTSPTTKPKASTKKK